MCSTREQVQRPRLGEPVDQMAVWKANRRLWVEALRGGAYEQGQSYLRGRDDKFCCLGVLADIAGCKWERNNDGNFSANSEDQTAPKLAMDFVGLKWNDGAFVESRDEDVAFFDALAELNDGGKSFAEIADVIEQEPEGLFREGA